MGKIKCKVLHIIFKYHLNYNGQRSNIKFKYHPNDNVIELNGNALAIK